MHQMVPTIYYFFWVRYHPNKIYSQKKSRQETKYGPPFPPTTKPHPLNPLDRGPTSLVLAGYRLVVTRPFCACFTIFCVCLPRRVYHSKLVLFRSTACFVLFLHTFPATFVIFLWFGFSFLHIIPAADTSCRSLFLFVVLLHISFHAYPFIQKNLGLCGPDNVDWIKRVLGPIYLCLPKPSCQRTIFYSRSFPLHFFLWTSLALWSFWWVFGPCFSLSLPPYGPLGMDSKNGHQQ